MYHLKELNMKKTILLALVALFMGLVQVSAQTAAGFEGETTSKMFSSQKMQSKVLTKNFLAKMITKSILKKYLDNNPSLYNGAYTATTICKGNKVCSKYTKDNSVVITIPEDGKYKIITYYPFIKKGYYTKSTVSAAQAQVNLEQMRKGNLEKTGETMMILGRRCSVYKMKYEEVKDSAGTKTILNMHNEFAICDDPSLPMADQNIVSGVKGVPLKFFTNLVTQTNTDMVNMDIRMAISTMITSITPRKVEDSEFEVPSDVKLVDVDAKPQEMFKIMLENTKYMKKHKLWVDPALNEDKIYDNLSEDWDF